MKAYMLLVPFILTGCGASVTDEWKGKTLECTDLRDGEVFEYNTDDITTMQHNPFTGKVSMSFTDSKGQLRYASNEHERWIKCSTKEESG